MRIDFLELWNLQHTSKASCHCTSFNGGMAPIKTFHSVIDNPEPVSRVIPPMTTMAKMRETSTEQPKNYDDFESSFIQKWKIKPWNNTSLLIVFRFDEPTIIQCINPRVKRMYFSRMSWLSMYRDFLLQPQKLNSGCNTSNRETKPSDAPISLSWVWFRFRECLRIVKTETVLNCFDTIFSALSFGVNCAPAPSLQLSDKESFCPKEEYSFQFAIEIGSMIHFDPFLAANQNPYWEAT